MGQLTYFLGLQIQYKENGDLCVNQTKYAKELLINAGMEHCKPSPTPSKPHTQLLISEGTPLSDTTLYRSLVRALQYLTFTRPDIAHVVGVVCQFMHQPTDSHYYLVKRIMRCIQGTLQCGLTYKSTTNHTILAFSDSDWVTNINTRRSITRFVVYLGSNPVSWQSKKQPSVSRSSTKAEYKALAHCAADVWWIRSLLKDLNVFLPSPPILHCDNLSALALTSNPVYHSRIKHLDTDYYFVREKVQKGDLVVQYIRTKEQVADIFTKGLHIPSFVHHCYNLNLGSPGSD
ncbi:uncharacterized mitochondrial protein AtMg00810-like [Pyrus x bretschneideri]|uniref:uncharacterized mitochondrial protein AtMg00810-like n=1 Tax=Pyrus x bretschneideri TaxID=225117 RepID=UPI00202F2BD0|nr:uncharacterized mitochondrial protein AtMg00810-like [Pyrus x bretschneideri]